MRLALSLARRGLGNVWPNPAVGCVIVQAGRIVGRGWTQPGGRPHAETEALSEAGTAAKGATAYVSLEPCAHDGKTPPCAKALIDAGITRVVSATQDSDSRVAGKGHAMLRAAGIAVETGLLEHETRALNLGFFNRIELGCPLVTLKLATSLDGRIATATGQSQWITGPEARRAVHAMRARHDAVLIGAGTARSDDPSLTVRDLGMSRQPVRIVASHRLDLPLDGVLAKTAGEVPVWLCHGDGADPGLLSAWEGLGAHLLPCKTREGRLDPTDMLNALGRAGLTRIFCEGGGRLAASLLRNGVVDELVLINAGLALGADGLPSVGGLGLSELRHADRFTLKDVRELGGDVMHRWIKPQ